MLLFKNHFFKILDQAIANGTFASNRYLQELV